MKRDVENPKAYLAAVEVEAEGEQREILMAIRRVIRRVMPRFKEELKYRMLDYPGLANLAAQKRYVALYVMPEVLAKHRASFADVDAGKSCLRFKRIDQIVPADLEQLLIDVLDRRRELVERDRPD